MKSELYCIDGVVFKDNKMLIPRALRKEVLHHLHSAHQCPTGMIANARQRFFWPGLNAQLRLVRSNCNICNEIAPSQAKQPLQEEVIFPTVPFQQTVTDLCEASGKSYIIYADRYTGWVEAALLSDKKAPSIIKNLRQWFITYGVPEELASDGGPPYNSMEYSTFLNNWGVKIRVSSAHFPQSNGRDELGVKTAK